MNSRQRRVEGRRGEVYSVAWAKARTAADAAALALGRFGRSFSNVTQAIQEGWTAFAYRRDASADGGVLLNGDFRRKEKACPKCGKSLDPSIFKEPIFYRILDHKGRFLNMEFCSKACGASYKSDESTP